MVSRSSHPALSRVDNFAAGSTDVLLLAGRILMSYLFLSAGWANSLTSSARLPILPR